MSDCVLREQAATDGIGRGAVHRTEQAVRQGPVRDSTERNYCCDAGEEDVQINAKRMAIQSVFDGISRSQYDA